MSLERLELADYKRRVNRLYADVRGAGGGEAAWTAWRAARDELFATHPQSPEAARSATFTSMGFEPYDPAWALSATVEPVDVPAADVDHSGAGSTTFTAVGRVRLDTPAGPAELTLLWLEGYGGGLFLPFRDATNGTTTYGGGRYLLDTVKGADLGGVGDSLVLDFNFAYHPSCAHDPRWSCPLSPPENRLAIPVPVGELLPT